MGFLVATSPPTCHHLRRSSLMSTQRSSPGGLQPVSSPMMLRICTSVSTRLSVQAQSTRPPRRRSPQTKKEKVEGGIRFTDKDGKEHFINRRRRTLSQRKNRVEQKKAFVLNQIGGDDDDEEEEDDE